MVNTVAPSFARPNSRRFSPDLVYFRASPAYFLSPSEAPSMIHSGNSMDNRHIVTDITLDT